MKLFNKLKKLVGISFALTVLLSSPERTNAQGAASAISFNGTSNANLGDSLSKTMAKSDFTIEMWIKVKSTSSDPVFIGNKNWASGANTGFAWCRYTTSNTLRFNFRADTRTRKDYNMTLDYSKWNHIAITVKRNGSIIGYVNGKQNGTPVSIAIDSAYTLDAALPVRIGSDGLATNLINGDMDELRIWNNVRTETEIRNTMCRKINGDENGLMAYYKMDETSGNTLTNSAQISIGNFDGTMVNNPSRIASGAAIGDTSVLLYGTTFTGETLNLGSPANGNVQLSNMGNDLGGIQIYKINSAPNTTTGITNPGTNNVYYGIFAVNDTVGYHTSYNYSNYPNAITFEGGIDLFRRNSLDSAWALWTATKNTTAKTLNQSPAKGRNEIILGSFVTSITCNAASALAAANITTNSALLSWTSGGSNFWNIAYGTGSFTPGTGGTIIRNVATPTYTLNTLQPNTTYQFYVQDTCAPIRSAGAWAGPYTFTTAIDYSTYGSGYGINFSGTSANEHVNLGDSLSKAIAFTDFTIETWIKFNNPSSDPAFIGNKNWDNGQNTGILWCWNGSNNLRFNFKPVGGTRRDYDINVPESSRWNHIAMVADRKGNLTAYLNGVQVGTPINISADSTRSLNGVLPIRIGQDGTGTYGQKFKGAMDELKIWRKALSPAEIRAYMCQKADRNDTSLLAYYKMDEATGNALTNSATATATVFNGTLLNNPQRIISGAAIGDTSIYSYPASWDAVSIALGSNAQGKLTVDSIASETKGIHIYRINNAPNFTSGIAQIGTTNQFFGVFTAGNSAAAYKMSYNYTDYPNAVSNKSHLHIYNRRDNAAASWIQSAAVNNTSSNTIVQQQQLGVRQYILADFAAATCPTPLQVTVSNIDTGNATIGWSSSATVHIIEYGNRNFALGTGTQQNSSGASLTLTNLNASSNYELYIKDSCNATSSSAWVGPYTFTTLNPCPKPFNITVDSITTQSLVVKWEDNGVVTEDYIVSWGSEGFGNPAFGIQTNVTEKRFELTDAAVHTAYDFYIRSNCNSSVSKSGWAGPFTFSTISCDVPTNLSASAITETSAKITWTSLAADHSLEYGPTGFTTGNGMQTVTLTDTFYNLTGLTAATTYDVYVLDSCSDTLGTSLWAGPYTFSTKKTVTSIDGYSTTEFKLYPNPAKDRIRISLPQYTKNTVLTLTNSLGVVTYQINADKDQIDIPVSTLTSGLYFIEVRNGASRSIKKIIVQH